MSEKPNYSEPAFPGFSYTDGMGPVKRNSDGEWETYVPGMTLLDYFAGNALNVLMDDWNGFKPDDAKRADEYSYLFAAAMLEARKAYL